MRTFNSNSRLSRLVTSVNISVHIRPIHLSRRHPNPSRGITGTHTNPSTKLTIVNHMKNNRSPTLLNLTHRRRTIVQRRSIIRSRRHRNLPMSNQGLHHNITQLTNKTQSSHSTQHITKGNTTSNRNTILKSVHTTKRSRRLIRMKHTNRSNLNTTSSSTIQTTFLSVSVSIQISLLTQPRQTVTLNINRHRTRHRITILSIIRVNRRPLTMINTIVNVNRIHHLGSHIRHIIHRVTLHTTQNPTSRPRNLRLIRRILQNLISIRRPISHLTQNTLPHHRRPYILILRNGIVNRTGPNGTKNRRQLIHSTIRHLATSRSTQFMNPGQVPMINNQRRRNSSLPLLRALGDIEVSIGRRQKRNNETAGPTNSKRQARTHPSP